MKTITHKDLIVVLYLHALWASRKPGGVRADLSGHDLFEIDLNGTKF